MLKEKGGGQYIKTYQETALAAYNLPHSLSSHDFICMETRTRAHGPSTGLLVSDPGTRSAEADTALVAASSPGPLACAPPLLLLSLCRLDHLLQQTTSPRGKVCPSCSLPPAGQWFTYLSDTCPPTHVPTEGSGTGEPTSPPWGPVSTPARQFNKM